MGDRRGLREIHANLVETVGYLSRTVGERSFTDTEKLDVAAGYIESRLRAAGCAVTKQPFTYRDGTYYNVVGEVEGTGENSDGLLVVGAHYDTVPGTPGADDNASGVAALLELARLTASKPIGRTVHFVAFSLEEFPAFRTRHMGSYFYAALLKERATRLRGMISLEMLGYYCEADGCQLYPSSLFRLFYPARGNFIAFVGNLSSRRFMSAVKEAFIPASRLPVKSLTGVSLIPGVDFSDHRNFWKFGYPAFMITDTAFYRNPYYHGPGDTADTLAYAKMAELVAGLYAALSKV